MRKSFNLPFPCGSEERESFLMIFLATLPEMNIIKPKFINNSSETRSCCVGNSLNSLNVTF